MKKLILVFAILFWCSCADAETALYGEDIIVAFTPSVSQEVDSHRLYFKNLSTGKELVTEDILLPTTWFTFDRSLFAPATEYVFTGTAITITGRESGRSLPLHILIGPEIITPPPEPPAPVKPGKGIGRDKKR